MDKIFSKIGLYDIIGIWLSGAISLAAFYLLNNYVPLCDFSIKGLSYKEFVFIILSYFVGIVLQEIGNILQMRLFNKNSRYIKNVLKPANRRTKLLSYTYLSKKELNIINQYFGEKFDADCSVDFKYHYCWNNLPKDFDYSGHNQSMAVGALSRSLSVSYFLFTCAAIRNMALFGINKANVITVVVCLIITLLLWSRSARLLKMRYEKVFRTFYFNNLK